MTRRIVFGVAITMLIAAIVYLLRDWLIIGCDELLDVKTGDGWVWRAALALILVALRLIGTLCAGIGAVAIALAVETELLHPWSKKR